MEELSRTLTTGENWYLSPSTSTMLAMAVRVRLSIRRQAGSPMSSDSVCAHLNICIRVMRTRVTGVQRRGAVMRRGAPMKSTSCCTVMSTFGYSGASNMADPKRLELKKKLGLRSLTNYPAILPLRDSRNTEVPTREVSAETPESSMNRFGKLPQSVKNLLKHNDNMKPPSLWQLRNHNVKQEETSGTNRLSKY